MITTICRGASLTAELSKAVCDPLYCSETVTNDRSRSCLHASNGEIAAAKSNITAAIGNIQRLKGSTGNLPLSPSGQHAATSHRENDDTPTSKKAAATESATVGQVIEEEIEAGERPSDGAAKGDPVTSENGGMPNAASIPGSPSVHQDGGSGLSSSVTVKMECITDPSARPLSASIEVDHQPKRMSIKLELRESPTYSTRPTTPHSSTLQSHDQQTNRAQPSRDISAESEQKGVATLIAMRRSETAIASRQAAPIPAPLATGSLKTVLGRAAPGSALGSGRLTSIPSSHPYYRSDRVLASPSSARSVAMARVHGSVRTPSTPSGQPASAGLRGALRELRLESPHMCAVGSGMDQRQRPTFSLNMGTANPSGGLRSGPMSALPTCGAAAFSLNEGPNGSPRIFIPPPSASAARCQRQHDAAIASPSLVSHLQRPVKHLRTTSDTTNGGGHQSAQLPGPPALDLRSARSHLPRSAAPPAMTPTTVRRYIAPPAPASPIPRRMALPRSPPAYPAYTERDELPVPTPHRESFLRRGLEDREDETMLFDSGATAATVPPRKLTYQPCGTVETRPRAAPMAPSLGSPISISTPPRRVLIPPPPRTPTSQPHSHSRASSASSFSHISSHSGSGSDQAKGPVLPPLLPHLSMPGMGARSYSTPLDRQTAPEKGEIGPRGPTLKRSYTDAVGLDDGCGSMRYIDPVTIPASTALARTAVANQHKRYRAESTQSDESSLGSVRSTPPLSGPSIRHFIPPPAKGDVPAALGQAGTKTPLQPATPGAAGDVSSSILNQLMSEVNAAGAEGAHETAQALEDVANTLSQVAQTLRRSR